MPAIRVMVLVSFTQHDVFKVHLSVADHLTVYTTTFYASVHHSSVLHFSAMNNAAVNIHKLTFVGIVFSHFSCVCV